MIEMPKREKEKEKTKTTTKKKLTNQIKSIHCLGKA